MTTTIAAIGTPAGEGGIAVIRISGPDASRILLACTNLRRLPEPRHMTYCKIMRDGVRVEEGLAVYMPSPHSYTGEDTVELQVHGGRQTGRDTLDAALHAGARLAAPGEFTRRAFENGRLDLSQAEAVMDVIQASSHRDAQMALDQLDGSLGKKIGSIREDLLNLLARIEAALDYAQEEFLDLQPGEVEEALSQQEEALQKLLSSARTARIYKDGIRCTLAGLPNAGKSSLMNALLGEERAIVTDIAGTTRDTLEAEISFDGLRVILTDTAGLRSTQDRVEAIGVERAKAAIESSQLTLFLLDASRPVTKEDQEMLQAYCQVPHLLVASKWDETAIAQEELHSLFPEETILPLSSHTGEGLHELLQAIAKTVDVHHLSGGEAALTRQRHVECVRQSLLCIQEAKNGLEAGFPVDIAADEIRRSWHELGAITGDTVDEDVIDRIFEKFCLGK